MTFWIDIEQTDGSQGGSSGIDSATDWQSEQLLDAAGPASFSMPLIDPRADLCVERRTARCWTIRAGSPVEVGAFIISKLEESVSADGDPMLNVSGNDLSIALADRTVRTNLQNAGNPVGAANVLPAIMTPAPSGWTTTGTPSAGVYFKFVNETILSALIKAREQTGDHFRRTPGKLEITWLPITAGFSRSGLILDQTGVHGLITDLRRNRDGNKRITRLYFRGAGTGTDTVTADAGSWTPPAGYTLVRDGIDSYIKYDSADTAYQIDGDQAFKDMSVGGADPDDPGSAADALSQVAYTYLRTRVTTMQAFDVTVVGLSTVPLPGQTVRVVYNDFRTDGTGAGRNVLALDAELIVWSVRTAFTAEDDEPTYSLTVTDTDRYPDSSDTALLYATRRLMLDMGGHT